MLETSFHEGTLENSKDSDELLTSVEYVISSGFGLTSNKLCENDFQGLKYSFSYVAG